MHTKCHVVVVSFLCTVTWCIVACVCRGVATEFSRSAVSDTHPAHTSAVLHRYYHEMVLYALEVLQLVTLSAAPRPQVVGASVAHHPARSGMAVLLQAATGGVAAYRFPITTPEVRVGPTCAARPCCDEPWCVLSLI
jgi:hypothetical protein